jgi:hypothetical protein
MLLTLPQIQTAGKEISLYKPLGDTQKAFHLSNAFIKWLLGGNRSSKTYTNMMDLALLLLDYHPVHYQPGGVHWACTESWEQVRDILWDEKLKKFIPSHAIANIEYGQQKIPRRVFFKNGHKLEFKAFNQGRELFQGRALDSIYCDEQCHHDFIGILDEMQARLLANGSFLSWSMTPIKSQPELEERIEDLPDTDEVFKINLNDNRISRGGYIPDERIDNLIAQWPEETQATRIAGEFASFYGAVFKTYSRQIHVIEPFRIPSGWRKYRAFDFGFTNPFVCLWLAKDKDENWYIYREYYKKQTGIQEHIRNVKLLSMGESYVENIADPEDPENRSEMRKAGIKTIAAKKDVAKGIELVQSKFKVKENGKPSLFIFKTCRNTCREVAGYSYPKGTSSSNPKDIPVQKDDHTIDAARYGIYTIDGKFRKGHVCTA